MQKWLDCRRWGFFDPFQLRQAVGPSLFLAMNQISLMTATATGGESLAMSSREIADLTGKRHDNVMRDIRAMLVELHGEGGVLSFEDTQANQQNGQRYPVFMLPKRETLILVSGYSVEMRARIIDRWQELEAQVASPLPAPAININVLGDAVDRGLMSKRTASGMIKAWLLAQNPAMAAVLAAQRMRPTSAPAPVQLQIETKPQPKRKPAPKPFKLSPRRGRNEVDGVNFAIEEVATHCGVVFDDLLRSMRDHGLINGPGQITERGREFVAFSKSGRKHWKVGALIRHLSA